MECFTKYGVIKEAIRHFRALKRFEGGTVVLHNEGKFEDPLSLYLRALCREGTYLYSCVYMFFVMNLLLLLTWYLMLVSLSTIFNISGRIVELLEALETMAKDNQSIPPRAMILSRKYRTLVSSWIEPLQEEAELGYEIDYIARCGPISHFLFSTISLSTHLLLPFFV